MPSRRETNEDPFRRINSWDDGYEYIQAGSEHSVDGEPGPMYSPPAPTPAEAQPNKPARRSTYEPDYTVGASGTHNHPRHAYPSPPDSDIDTARGKHHHPHHRNTSPHHRHSGRRSPSPPRRRDTHRNHHHGARYRDDPVLPIHHRPHLDSSATAPPPRTKDTGARNRRPHSRSPSPAPTRDAKASSHRRSERERERDLGQRRHNRSPSPAGAKHDTAKYRDRDGRDSDTRQAGKHHQPPRAPSPPPAAPSKKSNHPPQPQRPTISRSKTTSAKEKFANLSPRWQKAAQAALQAGSMTAKNLSSQPGGWNAEKGARVATAALGAAAIDAFMKGGNGGDAAPKRDHHDDGHYPPSGGTRTGGGGGGGYKEKGGSGGYSRSSKKKNGVEDLGDAFGEFLSDQFAKKKGVAAGGKRD
ncbi:hypothetical protein B0H66DRAFT_535021 [Apodospora peruviana]|uniref:Uncharacterized protein n=1 Tax=Apodospora peruviana TaxID=516989 RepID=A0AAE0I1U0_9PEZI|nr:hypothetical protein B0H66DRAFT_535021 [Apodospora peruviana]